MVRVWKLIRSKMAKITCEEYVNDLEPENFITMDLFSQITKGFFFFLVFLPLFWTHVLLKKTSLNISSTWLQLDTYQKPRTSYQSDNRTIGERFNCHFRLPPRTTGVEFRWIELNEAYLWSRGSSFRTGLEVNVFDRIVSLHPSTVSFLLFYFWVFFFFFFFKSWTRGSSKSCVQLMIQNSLQARAGNSAAISPSSFSKPSYTVLPGKSQTANAACLSVKFVQHAYFQTHCVLFKATNYIYTEHKDGVTHEKAEQNCRRKKPSLKSCFKFFSSSEKCVPVVRLQVERKKIDTVSEERLRTVLFWEREQYISPLAVRGAFEKHTNNIR